MPTAHAIAVDFDSPDLSEGLNSALDVVQREPAERCNCRHRLRRSLQQRVQSVVLDGVDGGRLSAASSFQHRNNCPFVELTHG